MTKISLLGSIFFSIFEKFWKYGKDFLHARSISGKYDIIAFLTLEGSAGEWH